MESKPPVPWLAIITKEMLISALTSEFLELDSLLPTFTYLDFYVSEHAVTLTLTVLTLHLGSLSRFFSNVTHYCGLPLYSGIYSKCDTL
jgi:hypothetical protein